MSDYTLIAAIAGYLLLVVGALSLLVHLDVLGRGTAFRIGLVAIAPILAVPFVLDVMGRSESDAGNGDATKDSGADLRNDQLTEPEPSHESEPSNTPRDVRDADDLDDFVDALERQGARDDAAD